MKKGDEPKIDESQLTEAQKEELRYSHFSWPTAIFFGVLVLLIVVLSIVASCIPV